MQVLSSLEFQSSGTFSKSDLGSATHIHVTVIGGQGGGFGGGGGGLCHYVFSKPELDDVISVTVGAGGLDGQSGGASEFGALRAGGGGAGQSVDGLGAPVAQNGRVTVQLLMKRD